jgi:hypothetical protein
MEECSDGILLRPRGPAVSKLSWDDTAKAMAAEAEDWSEWDATAADGLQNVDWESSRGSKRRVAEPRPKYAGRGPRRKR